MEKLRKNNRKEIASYSHGMYSTEKMVAEYYALYDETVNNKKILLIDVNYKQSSTGQIVYDIYSRANQYKKKIAVCYGRGILYRDENVYKFGVDFETYIHAGLSRITGYNGCFSYFSTRRLIKYIERFKPDLIHIHELHAYFVNIEQLVQYIKRKKIPLVWTFHCEYMYTGKCGHAYECTKFQEECGKCPAVREYPKSLLIDRTKAMLKKKRQMLSDLDFTIVTPSNWSKSRVGLSFLKNKKIKTIFNGIDTNTFYPRNVEEQKKNIGINSDTKVVLFVSPNVFDENKGYQWIEQLATTMQDKDVLFLVVGKGTILKEYPSNIKFVGSISDKNVLAIYYTLADAFLLCSKRETYSLTCAEALCCGTPVVGYECGAPETVFAGENARFVSYGDLGKLKEALCDVLYGNEVE